LPDAPPELLDITPQQFIAFFRNPARHLLRHRLGVHLEESEGLLETDEPFVPGGLARYHLRHSLVEDWQVGVNTRDDAFALARARGALPHGAAGAAWFSQLWDGFAPFAEQVAGQGGEALPPCRIDLSGAGVRVRGSIAGLQQRGEEIVYLDWRVGEVRPFDKLSLWLNHVLLHAAGQLCTSRLLTPEDDFSLPPLNGTHIENLFGIYARGSRELLPFFPATSLHWLTLQRSEAKGKRGADWQRDWTVNQFNVRAESLDAYVDQAWQGCDPFNEIFAELAEALYAPMLDHAGESA
jgi:exonuclease V gamma subunit